MQSVNIVQVLRSDVDADFFVGFAGCGSANGFTGVETPQREY
jgi:hypothetical protein